MNNELQINDVFWTFQGEGFHAGRRALFIRMPYCNLKCSWCDTEFNSFKKWSENDLISKMLSEPAKFAVITGGEPMMHKHTPRVVELLKAFHFEVACESNGTYPILDWIDFPTVSPKREAKYQIHPQAFEKAREFKYVVDHDFDWSVLTRHNTSDGKRYSLSPEFGTLQKSLKEIYNYIQKNPQWRISLQTHKWMEIA